MGELGSGWRAASATLKASILSGVGSGEGGLNDGSEGDDNRMVCAIVDVCFDYE